MIRAVLFDLDGVVRHFDPEHVADIERRHGILPGAIERFAFDQPLIEHVTTGKITRREWVARIARHLRNPDAAAEWDSQPYRADPAMLELADELRALGIATAILTNGTDTIPAEAARLGLPARFDQIFNSATIGYIKPDRRAFAHVLGELRLPATDVLFTDDSPTKLAGADALGLSTHHFVGVKKLRQVLRDQGVSVR